MGCLFAAMMSIELTQHVPAEVEGYIYRKENKVSERETNGDQRGEGNNRTADFPETKVNPEIGAAPIERIENTAATSQIIFTDSVQPIQQGIVRLLPKTWFLSINLLSNLRMCL